MILVFYKNELNNAIYNQELSVLLNGILEEPFMLEKGIRQEDLSHCVYL